MWRLGVLSIPLAMALFAAQPALAQSSTCASALQRAETVRAQAIASLRACKAEEEARLEGTSLKGRTGANACLMYAPAYEACWGAANAACDAESKRDAVRQSCSSNGKLDSFDHATDAATKLNDKRDNDGTGGISQMLTGEALNFVDKNGRMVLDAADGIEEMFPEEGNPSSQTGGDSQRGAETGDGLRTDFEGSDGQDTQDLGDTREVQFGDKFTDDLGALQYDEQSLEQASLALQSADELRLQQAAENAYREVYDNLSDADPNPDSADMQKMLSEFEKQDLSGDSRRSSDPQHATKGKISRFQICVEECEKVYRRAGFWLRPDTPLKSQSVSAQRVRNQCRKDCGRPDLQVPIRY